MTRRRPPARQGRPPRDYSGDPDVEVAELAFALQAAWGLSERAAIDLALAICQGKPCAPSKRGAGVLVSYALPRQRTFRSRNADIRRKLKVGKLRPDAEVVLKIARLLQQIRRLRV
jgi:hypothetical protein